MIQLRYIKAGRWYRYNDMRARGCRLDSRLLAGSRSESGTLAGRNAITATVVHANLSASCQSEKNAPFEHGTTHTDGCTEAGPQFRDLHSRVVEPGGIIDRRFRLPRVRLIVVRHGRRRAAVRDEAYGLRRQLLDVLRRLCGPWLRLRLR